MAYAELPAFIARLPYCDGASSSALSFTILTAARTGETIGATWDEIDIEKRVWTIPAERMKAGKEHRVPLCDRALEILSLQPRYAEFIFSGRGGRPLSNMAMTMVLRRMDLGQFTVHGFRSTFRDWAGNETSFPREIAEAALAHVVGGVEGAYRRSDALEKRRTLMNDWSKFCFSEVVKC